ncbi:MAG: ADP-glyceromanno-heptose 6-epimerase [Planctomycetota bacterium]
MIIVTGGAGFIGSNLVRGLNAQRHTDIVIVDDLEQGGKHRNLNSLAFTDLVDYRDFARDLDRWSGRAIEAVFHQGACSDTMVHDGRFMLSVNYEYSKLLLEFCQGRCPFLYASSASVYGDGDDGFREEEVCEYPLNVYAFSKFLFDRHVRRVLPTASTQIIGLRYFNVYGPQENHKDRMASVVYKFHHQIAETGTLSVFEGSESFRRDFVHVDDAVAMNLHFFQEGSPSGIFNCGTGTALSFRALAEEVAKHYDGTEVVEIPFPDSLTGKYQAFTQADLTSVRRAGYVAEPIALAEGVAAYVAVLKETGGYHRHPVAPRTS